MLKFLTHKLRTHSLNEDSPPEKIDGHDSGTESDEDIKNIDSRDQTVETTMKWTDVIDINMASLEHACIPRYPVSDDLLYDHHSSEEELEVINGAPSDQYSCRSTRGNSGSSNPPSEKRKWENDENESRLWDDSPVSGTQTPVRFRTSPPLEALKPRQPPRYRAASPLALHNLCVCPAPPKLRHVSPSSSATVSSNSSSLESSDAPSSSGLVLGSMPANRKRTRNTTRRAPARPCLDFDKMQQLKVRTATAWRHHSEHGAELSVFCW